MLTLVGSDLPTFSFATGSTFVIPDFVDGDLGVILIGGQGGDASHLVTPEGWTFIGEDNASSARCAAVYAKWLDDDDIGASVVVDTAGSIDLGVLLVLRGAHTLEVLPSDLADGGLDVLRSIGTTSHATPETDGNQDEDLRIMLWLIENNVVTFTPPVWTNFTFVAQTLEATAGWRIGWGYYRPWDDGSHGALTGTTSASANGVDITATIRAYPPARPSALVSDHNGNIGLVCDEGDILA